MPDLLWNKELALKQLDGDQELMDELMVLFQGAMAADLDLMQSATIAGDTQTVGRAAHNIKGAASSLGLEAIRRLAVLVEEQARRDSLASAEKYLPALQELLAEVKKLT